MTDKVVTYQPDNCLRQGYSGLLRDIIADIRGNSWLTLQLLRRDLFGTYKQSIVGLLWLIINPLVAVGTFVLLNRSGVFDVGEINVPYPIYAVLGMAMWQLLAVGITASANSLVAAGSMISKINFSKKSLVLASTGNSVLSFVVQLLLLLVLFALYGTLPSPLLALIAVLAVPMVLFAMGIGFLVALLNAVIRDVGTAIPILVNFLLLLTPVLYAKPKEGLIGILADYNPIYYLVVVPRDIALGGRSDQMAAYAISAAIGMVIFIAGLTIFHLTESRVAERI